MYSSHWFFLGTWSVSEELTCVSSQQLTDRWWIYHIRAVTKIVQYRNSVCFSECVPRTFCWNHHEFGCWVPILHPDLLSKNWVTGLSSLTDLGHGAWIKPEDGKFVSSGSKSSIWASCRVIPCNSTAKPEPNKGSCTLVQARKMMLSVWWHKQILCLLKQTENLHWN